MLSKLDFVRSPSRESRRLICTLSGAFSPSLSDTDVEKTCGAVHRAAKALRLAANALHRSDTALGAFLRRKKGHLGAPKAITATAHKLARIIYSMLRYGQQYVDAGAQYYESQYQHRALRAAKRRAAQLGYQLVPLSDALASAVPHSSEVAPA